MSNLPTRRIRILFTIPNFITAGSGREMFNIIEHLNKEYFDVLVAIEKSSSVSTLENEIREKGYTIVVHRLRFQRTFSAGAFVRAVAHFRKYKIDLWQSFDYSSDFTEPLLARLSGAAYGYVKKNMNWDRKSWKIKSVFSTFIIARNTTLVSRHFNSIWFRRKTTFITGGVDHVKFARRDGGPMQFRKEMDKDKFVVCCVANLIPIKGQIFLLEALKALPERVIVWLAGRPSDRDYVKELENCVTKWELSSRVVFLGSVTDTPALLNESDAFVLPTVKDFGHEEGCPVALLEAMACQIPCIATNVAGSNDLIQNQVNGLLVDSSDAEALAGAIRFAIDNAALTTKMALVAREDIVKEHTLEAETSGFEKLYLRQMGKAVDNGK